VSSLANIRVAVPTNNLSVKVPDVEGKSYDEIKSAFESLKLLTQKTYEPSDKIAVDDVIRIDPPAGTAVSPNTSITVYLSSGKELVKVPNLVDTNEADATAALTALGLKLGVITQQNSPNLAKGTIISSDPEQYAKVSPGTAVDLITSSGKVTVPSVVQQSVTTAKAQLTGPNVSFTVSVETQTVCNGTKGQIVTGQSIEPGDANQRQRIILYVDCIGGTEPSATPTAEPTL
jgi:serine/threonine-protein kinase